MQQGCSLLSLQVNTVLQVLDRASKQENETKGIQIGMDKVKLCLFFEDMILFVDNPKDYHTHPHTHTYTFFSGKLFCIGILLLVQWGKKILTQGRCLSFGNSR